jgi:hypothetical protein
MSPMDFFLAPLLGTKRPKHDKKNQGGNKKQNKVRK